METASLLLQPLAPFDFGASLRFLREFPATAGEQIVGDDDLIKALREGGCTVLALLTSTGTVDKPELSCELTADEALDPPVLAAVEDRLRFWLGLDDDVADFYGRADPEFSEVVRQLYGYHQVKFPSPVEHVCWAILGQRTPMRVAQTIKRRLVEAYDNRFEVDDTEVWAFPDLDQLRSLGADDLGSLVGNQRKVGYLHGAFEALADVDEEFLRHGSYDEVRDFLLSIPGIGPWSASFVLIRGLGRSEDIPFEKEAASAASRIYGRELDEDEFRQLAARYGSWQGYWGHYLRVASL
ncbi:MAG TPA: hypothetical protein VGJ86_17660 [Acidimicrobiales bacterium]|jgi:DNA-3-methyladenine glycosylase II